MHGKMTPQGGENQQNIRLAWCRIEIGIFLFFGISLAVGYISLLDLLPPVARDELIHHLAIPKIWIEAGGFVETPWATFSYYPMNIQLLYLAPLALGVDWGAKFIHNGFGLLTGLLVFLHLRRRLNMNWGLLGALVFLSIPIVMRLAASAYVDLGLAFFYTAAVLAMVQWRGGKSKKWLFLSALAMGLALGSKYQAFIGFAPLAFWVAYLGWRERGYAAGLSSGAIFVAIALLLFLPWGIKNFVLTGNPTFPLLNWLWSLPSEAPADAGVNLFMQREYFYGEDWLQFLLIPLRIFFQGRDFSPQFFDGVLNPLLLLIPLLAFFRWKKRPEGWELPGLALISIFWILVIYYKTALIVRYLAPIYPLLAILFVYGLVELRELGAAWFGRSTGRVLVVITTICFLSLNAFWAIGYWKKIDPWPYLSGIESRQEYLARHLDYFSAVKYINHNTPVSAKVLLLFTGNQGYYLDRDYFYSTYFSGEIIRPIIESARSSEDVLTGFKSLEADYLLIREDLLLRFLKDNHSPETLNLIYGFLENHTFVRFRERGYAVYEIR